MQKRIGLCSVTVARLVTADARFCPVGSKIIEKVEGGNVVHRVKREGDLSFSIIFVLDPNQPL